MKTQKAGSARCRRDALLDRLNPHGRVKCAILGCENDAFANGFCRRCLEELHSQPLTPQESCWLWFSLGLSALLTIEVVFQIGRWRGWW